MTLTLRCKTARDTAALAQHLLYCPMARRFASWPLVHAVHGATTLDVHVLDRHAEALPHIAAFARSVRECEVL